MRMGAGIFGRMLVAASMLAVRTPAIAISLERHLGREPLPLRRRRRAKPVARAFFSGRSHWIPAGPHRNCGDRGISPKLFERTQARLAAMRKAAE